MVLAANRGNRVGMLLRRMTYLPQLQAFARFLGLRGLLRKWYYHLALPRGGIVPVNLGDIYARFYAHTPSEFRMIEGCGELHILEKLISVLRPGDSAYDVGACIGLYTVLLAKAVGPEGQVIAVEPDSENYRKLRENIQLNNLTNVRVFRKALGEAKAQKTLYRGHDITDSSLLGPPTGKDIGNEVVEMVDGDSFRESENLPIPRVVKVDVEGYEHAVLQGLHRTLGMPACELVCCEIHSTALPAEVTPERIVSFLRSLGFSRIECDASPGYLLFHITAHKAASGGS